ncbi:MAG: hypothetical protein AAGJ40_06360 [Planctomycetota bacterium]
MTPEKKTLLLPVLMIATGIGWLLSAMNVAPGINWVWTLSLAAVGILTFVISGLDKFTVVFGPLLIGASCLSVLRQTGRLHLDIEVPILVIFVGLLLLIARVRAVPIPTWAVEPARAANNEKEA